MKKIMLFAFPLFLVTFFCFLGCSNGNAFVFETQEDVVIYSNMSESIDLSEYENYEDLNVVYDNEYFDCNQNVFVPKKNGHTEVVVTYQVQNDRIKKVFNVNIKEAVFANQLDVEENLLLKNDQFATYKFEPETNGTYNLGIFYDSTDEQVFVINSDGIITPKGEGQAVLKTKVISGFNTNSGKVYTEKQTQVVVESFLTQAEIGLYKNKADEVERAFYGTKTVGEEDFYYVQVCGNSKLDKCKFYLRSDNQNVLEQIAITDEEFSLDKETAYLKLQFNGSFSANLWLEIVDDSAKNRVCTFVTNSFEISTFKYVSEQSFSVYTCSTDKKAQNFQNLTDSDLIELEFDQNSKKHTLYSLGGQNEDKILGHQNQKYFYALICFDKCNLDCYNNFTITSNSNLLLLTKISENLYYVETLYDGDASLTVTSNDGGGYVENVLFDIQTVDVEDCTFFEQTNISMLIEDAGIDVSVTNIVPSYASFQMVIEIFDEQNASITVAEDGKTIIPIKVGNSTFKVSLGSRSKTYYVSVSTTGVRIVLDTDSNYELPINNTQEIHYQIVDTNGNLANDQTVYLYVLSQTLVDNNSVIEPDFAFQSVGFTSYQAASIKFVLQVKQDEIVISQSHVIEIVFI